MVGMPRNQASDARPTRVARIINLSLRVDWLSLVSPCATLALFVRPGQLLLDLITVVAIAEYRPDVFRSAYTAFRSLALSFSFLSKGEADSECCIF